MRHLFTLSLLAWLTFVEAATECTQVTEIPQSECEALIILYNNTGGPNWSDSPGNNWNITNTPCSWEGITCESIPNVTHISRVNKNLQGSIPSALSALTELRQLLLNDNQLSNAIPAQLGNLTNLVSLGLSGNRLTGAIPISLGNLTALQVAELYSNDLSGAIPATFMQLTSLDF